jgi:DNA polymerase III subunit delta
MADHPAAFLFLGPEIGLKSEEIDRIRSSITKRDNAPPEEHRYYLPEDSVDDAVATLRNGALFASHRLVLLNGVELLKKKAELSALTSYCAKPSADATLIMLSDATRVAAALEKAVPGERKKIFWEMFDNQKRGWLSGYVRKRGLRIQPEAVDLMLELVTNDTATLSAEIDRLCIYAGKGGEITEEHVDAYVYHSREESVFSVFRYVSDGDLKRALSALAKMVGSGGAKPPAVCAGLLFQLRRLLSVRRQVDDGARLESAMDANGVRGKRIRSEFAESIGRFTVEQLEACITTVADTDLACRTAGAALHEILLELMVYQLIQRRTAINVVETALWA